MPTEQCDRACGREVLPHTKAFHVTPGAHVRGSVRLEFGSEWFHSQECLLDYLASRDVTSDPMRAHYLNVAVWWKDLFPKKV
jgi:hypothetical protein